MQELKSHPRRSLKSPEYFRVTAEPVPKGLIIETEPTVLIIGGGNSGLSVAAYLQDCGVKATVIERNRRIGDAWRKRYKTLRLHSPRYTNSMPFFREPSNWPLFQTKDQFADYLESYASLLELDVWLGTTFRGAEYDDISGRWTVELVSASGTVRIIQPKHIVWAGSAFFGPQAFFTGLAGYETFQGLSYHASEHHSASDIPDIKNKKVVVVGSKTTAHDICQDFVNAGAASVTMIQRSSTIVHSPEAAVQILLRPPPEGMSVEDYRFIQQSMPLPVQLELVGLMSKLMVQFDQQLLKNLEKTEFVASKCENGDTFLKRSLGNRGGGYYVNHGASELIASGDIKVAFCCQGVEKITADGVVLADGRVLEANVIVAATGFEHIEDHLAEVMGEKVASIVSQLDNTPGMRHREGGGGLESLWKGIYKPTGHPGFWMALGNLQQTPPGAEALALQIVAAETGLLKP